MNQHLTKMIQIVGNVKPKVKKAQPPVTLPHLA
jgi:hypothetical protein